MIFLRDTKAGLEISVWAQPKASKTRVVGVHGEALKIAVQAPPVDGAANEEISEFLAGLLGVAARQVQLHKGPTSRQKVFLIAGVPLATAKEKIAGALP